jgi:hypothetical protein
MFKAIAAWFTPKKLPVAHYATMLVRRQGGHIFVVIGRDRIVSRAESDAAFERMMERVCDSCEGR